VRGNGSERTIKIAKADNACGGAIELDGIQTNIVCQAVNKKQATTCTTGVVVPVALYKIVYDTKRDAAYAFVLPNRNHTTGLGAKTHAYLEQWRTNVGVIEKLTGLQFFRGLPAARHDKIVKQCAAGTLW
jgi:DNA/RNA endonuclease G (NUC1)